MKNSLCGLLILVSCTLTLNGQNIKKIDIDVSKSSSVNLSQIAESVEPIAINAPASAKFDVIEDVVWGNDSFYLCVISVNPDGKRLSSIQLYYSP